MNKQKWTVPRTKDYTDPRIHVAAHIGWYRPFGYETEFTLPEPDNFNYAVRDPRPHDCPHVKNQVFFKDTETTEWWSVYFVTSDLLADFLAWAEPINFTVCFAPHRHARMRTFRSMLWTKKAQPDQTFDERLYLMGYYNKLQQRFNVDLSKQVGEPRQDIPQGEFT